MEDGVHSPSQLPVQSCVLCLDVRVGVLHSHAIWSFGIVWAVKTRMCCVSNQQCQHVSLNAEHHATLPTNVDSKHAVSLNK